MFQAGFYLNLLSENQGQGCEEAISFEEVWCLRKGVLLGSLNKSDSTLLKKMWGFPKNKTIYRKTFYKLDYLSQAFYFV